MEKRSSRYLIAKQLLQSTQTWHTLETRWHLARWPTTIAVFGLDSVEKIVMLTFIRYSDTGQGWLRNLHPQVCRINLKALESIPHNVWKTTPHKLFFSWEIYVRNWLFVQHNQVRILCLMICEKAFVVISDSCVMYLFFSCVKKLFSSQHFFSCCG